MTLIPYPFRNLNRFFKEDWPEIWEGPMSDWRLDWRLSGMKIPRMDVYEDNGNVVVEAELPGVNPKDIELEIKENILKIETKIEKKKEEKEKEYYRKELNRGYYRRAIYLPAEVIEDKVEAVYEEGILKIVIPKVKGKKVEKKRIKIKIKNDKDKK